MNIKEAFTKQGLQITIPVPPQSQVKFQSLRISGIKFDY